MTNVIGKLVARALRLATNLSAASFRVTPVLVASSTRSQREFYTEKAFL